jgi:hypothetical protein
MDNKELVQKLIRFKDKAYCTYTHQQAWHIWQEIGGEVAKRVPHEIYEQITTEWGHVHLGHGLHQACAALNTEIQKCIQYLEERNEGNEEKQKSNICRKKF